jgi:hypothetical protein
MSHSILLKTKVINSKEYLFDELEKKVDIINSRRTCPTTVLEIFTFEKKYPS